MLKSARKFGNKQTKQGPIDAKKAAAMQMENDKANIASKLKMLDAAKKSDIARKNELTDASRVKPSIPLKDQAAESKAKADAVAAAGRAKADALTAASAESKAKADAAAAAVNRGGPSKVAGPASDMARKVELTAANAATSTPKPMPMPTPTPKPTPAPAPQPMPRPTPTTMGGRVNPMGAPAKTATGPGLAQNIPAMKKGGSVSKASSRGDGIAQRGKTKGRYL